MNGIPAFRRSAIVTSVIVLSVSLLVTCIGKQSDRPADTRNAAWEKFAGSDKCAGCHKEIYDSHIRTAHYLTSAPATEKKVRGSFKAGENSFSFGNGVAIAMEKRDSGLYQVEYINGAKSRLQRFDILFGSGKKGQTYLNWHTNRLLQLPISYFTAADQWSNSPGFPGRAAFNRPITSRCMECHTTYAQQVSAPGVEPEAFDRSNIMYGIDCEKCHGPAAAHVAFQSLHPAVTTAKFIVNPAALSRQQNIDMCALCHGGRLTKTKPSFTFSAGDTLSNYFAVNMPAANTADIDVHGNQYGLLAASKCFKNSAMTCTSCHNTHGDETGNTALFSQRCMNCHSETHGSLCKMSSRLGASIVNNCIDCHMPVQPSRAIAVMLQGAATPTAAKMRSHLIKIYPEETKQFMDVKKHGL